MNDSPQKPNSPPKIAPNQTRILLKSMRDDISVTKWDGQEKHPQGHIAIIGYNDFLQNILMARFIKDIKLYFDKLYFLVPRPLVEVMKGVSGCDAVYDLENFQKPVSHYAALREALAHIKLHTDGLPYIELSPELRQAWQRRIPDRKDSNRGLRVGLMWGSDEVKLAPDAVASEDGKENKSDLTFLAMANFLRLPEHEFFSFQTGSEALMHSVHHFNDAYDLVDLFPYLGDFNEIAGALSRMDLLISWDNSTAHLAAAMGCNVWLVAPPQSDAWYWRLEEQKLASEREEQVVLASNPNDEVKARATMWYQSMRIASEITAGDWRAPLQAMMKNLSRMRRQVSPPSVDAGTGEEIKSKPAQKSKTEASGKKDEKA